jgi:hypothetical protein
MNDYKQVSVFCAFLFVAWGGTVPGFAQTEPPAPQTQAQAEKPLVQKDEGDQNFKYLYELPIRPLPRHGGPLAKIRLNDAVDGTFLLDTGAAGSHVFESALSRLNLKKERVPDRLKKYAPRYMPGVVNIKGFQFGWRTDSVELAVMRNKLIEQNVDADGIVGLNVMKWAVLFDFGKQTVTVMYPGNVSPPMLEAVGFGSNVPSQVLPLEQDEKNGMYYVTVQIRSEDTKEPVSVRVLLDTGASNTAFPASVMASTQQKPFGKIYSGTVHGPDTYNVYQVDNLYIGNHRVPPVLCTEESTKRQLPPVLGINVLSNFTILADFAGKMLYLKPATSNNAFTRVNQQRYLRGMTIGPDQNGVWSVVEVEPKSEAAKSRVQIGDVILKINGYEPAARPWIVHYNAFWAAKKFEVELLRAGSDTPIKLAIKR